MVTDYAPKNKYILRRRATVMPTAITTARQNGDENDNRPDSRPYVASFTGEYSKCVSVGEVYKGRSFAPPPDICLQTSAPPPNPNCNPRWGRRGANVHGGRRPAADVREGIFREQMSGRQMYGHELDRCTSTAADVRSGHRSMSPAVARWRHLRPTDIHNMFRITSKI